MARIPCPDAETSYPKDDTVWMAPSASLTGRAEKEMEGHNLHGLEAHGYTRGQVVWQSKHV